MGASTKTPRVADFLLSWDRLGFRLLVFGSLALAWILQGMLAGQPWRDLVLMELGGLLPWAFLAPLVLSLNRRIQHARPGAGRYLAAHLLGMVLVFVPYWCILRGISFVWRSSVSGWHAAQLTALLPTTLNLIGGFLNVPFVYFLIVLGAEAMQHAQARQEEGVEAGRLARQLSDAPRAPAAPAPSSLPLQRAPGDLDAAPSRSRHRRSAPGPPVRPAAGAARGRIRARDEAFIVFGSPHRGGVGGGDLFISFRESDGSWSDPKNLGATVNTPGYEFGPYVTDDKRYLFYSSSSDFTRVDIDWIRFDDLLETLLARQEGAELKMRKRPSGAMHGSPSWLFVLIGAATSSTTRPRPASCRAVYTWFMPERPDVKYSVPSDMELPRYSLASLLIGDGSATGVPHLRSRPRAAA